MYTPAVSGEHSWGESWVGKRRTSIVCRCRYASSGTEEAYSETFEDTTGDVRTLSGTVMIDDVCIGRLELVLM